VFQTGTRVDLAFGFPTNPAARAVAYEASNRLLQELREAD
jgi:hypothetical protein